jgi:CheY-like chemotaxis protein
VTLEVSSLPDGGIETIGFQEREKPRVLVVEDEPLISMLIEEMLTELGYDVIGPVATVSDALAAVEANHNIGCALLDFQLKGERTLGIADVLIDRRVPFAFASGFGPLEIENCRHRGAPSLPKPFTMNMLTTLLDQIVAQRTPDVAQANDLGS